MGTLPSKRRIDSESLDQYLREISAYPLIDRESEVELAQRIRANDPEALETLVRSNLRFVVSVAKRYQNQGVSLEDLINEGNIGLMRAAQKFDETRGIKFISYAVWWIRQGILQALADQSRIVRVPVSRAGVLQRVLRHAESLRQELGREPTPEEIAGGLEMSGDEIEYALLMSQSHLSLDAPLVPGEDGQLMDYLSDDSGDEPDRELYEQALSGCVDGMLQTLNARESEVVRLYFGLGQQESMTLEQIGERFGVTRERVRQIKERALSRLRHQSRARFLEAFLE